MRTLIVYDNMLSSKRIPASSLKRNDEVLLFPLTSLTGLAGCFRALAKEIGFSLTTLESAQLINMSADQLRNKYLDLVTELGLDVRHEGKNLREWFAVDEVASMWWMSLVAEKNTFKSDAFNRLAQCDAIIEILSRYDIRSAFLAIDNPPLEAVLSSYMRKKGIAYQRWPMRTSSSWRKRIKEYPAYHLIKHFLHLVTFAVSFSLRVNKIRAAFKPYQRRLADPDQFMLMNAFPYLDPDLARQGIFRNKQYDQLQVALEERKKKILWALFYVNNETISFNEAIAFAKRFIENGQNIYFIEEGCSPAVQLRTLVKLGVQAIKFLTVESKIAKRYQWKGYDFYPIFKDEWCRSFVGPEAYQALLFYVLFQDLLKKVKAQKGLYCCEMQSWEKALIFAKKRAGSQTSLLAYQHTTVSYMLLNYFTTPMEINTNGRYSMAQPDKLICNGAVAYGYMKDSGWSPERLAVAEAIRFNEFKKYLLPVHHDKKNIVLLALSISVEESSSLLNVVLEAFGNNQSVEVWVKPHPFVQFERVLQFSGLSYERCPFQIKREPIEELLKVAKVTIAGESSVSLQALLFGCEVIVVNVPEWINMSPLKGFDLKKIHAVNSPQELRETVLRILGTETKVDVSLAETRTLINKFFCLDESSDTPGRFLELLGVQF